MGEAPLAIKGLPVLWPMSGGCGSSPVLGSERRRGSFLDCRARVLSQSLGMDCRGLCVSKKLYSKVCV